MYGNETSFLMNPQFIHVITWRLAFEEKKVAGGHRTWKLHSDFRVYIKAACTELQKKIACFFQPVSSRGRELIFFKFLRLSKLKLITPLLTFSLVL